MVPKRSAINNQPRMPTIRSYADLRPRRCLSLDVGHAGMGPNMCEQPTTCAGSPYPAARHVHPCSPINSPIKCGNFSNASGARPVYYLPSSTAPAAVKAVTPASTPKAPNQASVCEKLEPGASVRLQNHRFTITAPLGEGSFGVVWAARGSDGTDVAIKEIPCKSESNVARVLAEGNLLRIVEDAINHSEAAGAGMRLPRLVASSVDLVSSGRWCVRFAMTQVPGTPVEQYLSEHRKCQALAPLSSQECASRCLSACRFAGKLLFQLTPALEAFSERVYHRDITPRNILVEEKTPHSCQFGLVDFGLAVCASKWHAQERGHCDLGGDGRYWPASAWFVFSHGTQELRKNPAMLHEYQKCLDLHSFGITTLRCFIELLPPLDGFQQDPGLARAMSKLQRLRLAWDRYWSDARRFWQPLFDAFRGNADFEKVRAAYYRAGVHETVRDDIVALRTTIQEACEACKNSPPESGLVATTYLFEALLFMLHAANVSNPHQTEEAFRVSGVVAAQTQTKVPVRTRMCDKLGGEPEISPSMATTKASDSSSSSTTPETSPTSTSVTSSSSDVKGDAPKPILYSTVAEARPITMSRCRTVYSVKMSTNL